MKKKHSPAKKRNRTSLQVEQFEARLLPTVDLTMVTVSTPTTIATTATEMNLFLTLPSLHSFECQT